MIPSLYNSNERVFSSNGIGKLTDAISCVPVEEINGEYECELTYPVGGLHYADIETEKIFLARVPNGTDQPFRIYRISKPLDGIVTINARHISYDLLKITSIPTTKIGTPVDAWNQLMTAVVNECPFTFTSSIADNKVFTLMQPASIKSVLGHVEYGFLELYGGELTWDRFAVNLSRRRGTDRGVTIRYGKNLTGIEAVEESETYNAIVPYAFDTDGNLVMAVGYVVSQGNYTNAVSVDVSDMIAADYPLPADVTQAGIDWLVQNRPWEKLKSIEIEFENLDEDNEFRSLSDIQIGDTVTVYHKEIGVNESLRAVRYEYDSLRERYNKVELGAAKLTIANKLYDDQQTLVGKINNNKFELQKFGIRMTDVEGDIGSLELTAQEFETRISGAEGDIGDLKLTDTSLQASISSAEGDIGQLQLTATSLTSRMDAADGNFSQLSQTVDGFSASISQANSNANLALSTAQGFSVDIQNADNRAQLALNTANGFSASISQANANANFALNTANGFSVDIQNAENHAQLALDTANGFSTSISQANSNANLALSTAQGFSVDIQNADDKAQLALDTTAGFSVDIQNADDKAQLALDTTAGFSVDLQTADANAQLALDTINGFNIRITNGSNSSYFELMSGQATLAAGIISLNGVVTFTDLTSNSMTTINGDYIKTGTIDGITINSTNANGENVRLTDGTIYFREVDSWSGTSTIYGYIKTDYANRRLYLYGGTLKIASGGDMSIDANNGYSIYIGTQTGFSENVHIGNGNGNIYLNGNVYVNGRLIS